MYIIVYASRKNTIYKLQKTDPRTRFDICQFNGLNWYILTIQRFDNTLKEFKTINTLKMLYHIRSNNRQKRINKKENILKRLDFIKDLLN